MPSTSTTAPELRHLLAVGDRLAAAIERRRLAGGVPGADYGIALGELAESLKDWSIGIPAWLHREALVDAQRLWSAVHGMLAHAGLSFDLTDVGTVFEGELLARRKAGDAVWLHLLLSVEEAFIVRLAAFKGVI